MCTNVGAKSPHLRLVSHSLEKSMPKKSQKTPKGSQKKSAVVKAAAKAMKKRLAKAAKKAAASAVSSAVYKADRATVVKAARSAYKKRMSNLRAGASKMKRSPSRKGLTVSRAPKVVSQLVPGLGVVPTVVNSLLETSVVTHFGGG